MMLTMKRSMFLSALIVLASLFIIENAAAAEMFAIRKIACSKRVTSVTGAFSSGLEGLGNIGGTAHQQWGVISVTYDSMPDWADDVEIKYYVLARDKKHRYNMFVGSTTYVSVMKGPGHMGHIFIHPNIILRYGQIKRAVVEIWYKGMLVSSSQWPTKTATRWWNNYKGIDGVLRHRFYTPFVLDYEAYEEAIKLPSSKL